MLKKVLNIIFEIILFVFASSFVAIAQKEDYNWILRNGIKINFNQQPPEVTTELPYVGGTKNSTTMSDKNGNLLFYVSHIKFYNSNHQSFFVSPPQSFFNQVNVVPYPTETKKYFWINTIFDSPLFKLSIYTIDMNANGGLGAGYETYEFDESSLFAITRKANSQDYWLIRIFSNRTEAYPLTDNGIINSPVISYLNIEHRYEYKLSPDMTKIFLRGTGGLGVLDIDIQTGETKNYRTIYTNSNGFNYNIEFSRNSEFIYMVKQNISNYKATISQFSMHALSNETEFLNSETVILDTTLSQYRQFHSRPKVF